MRAQCETMLNDLMICKILEQTLPSYDYFVKKTNVIALLVVSVKLKGKYITCFFF